MPESMIDDCGVRLVDPGKVAAVRSALPGETTVADLAQVFSLLGEPGRLLRAHRSPLPVGILSRQVVWARGGRKSPQYVWNIAATPAPNGVPAAVKAARPPVRSRRGRNAAPGCGG